MALNIRGLEMEQSTAFDNSTRPWAARLVAILEVVLVFAAVHVAYRSLQSFTEYGRWEASQSLNFIPGSVMVLATLGVLFAGRKDFKTYGLSPENWRVDLRLGLTWTIVGITVGAALVCLLDVRESFSGRNPPSIGLGMVSFLVKVAAAVVFAFIYRRKLPNPPRLLFSVLNVVLFLTLAISPLLVAFFVDAPLVHALLDLLWIGFVAGIGEEMFFRGYIQSRINATWGRPWRVLGVQFGVGLFLSALLFGFIHALNSVDYFHGRFTFGWGYGLMGIGLVSGVVRERTGSIWTGVVMHTLGNILGRAAALAGGVT